MTLQDLAELKLHIRNSEDAVLHLKEAERLLRVVKADDDQVTDPLLTATIKRNSQLFKEAQQ